MGNLAAGLLTVADEEGVIFIEKPFLWGQVFGEKRLESAVVIAHWGKTQAADDTPGIGIDDEDGLLRRTNATPLATHLLFRIDSSVAELVAQFSVVL